MGLLKQIKRFVPSKQIICLLFTVSLSFSYSCNKVFAQTDYTGIPQIINYEREVYEAGRQSWQITQDRRGFIYFANNSGLLQYDGSYWRTIPVSNNSVVRSVAIDSLQTIYLGAAYELGFLKSDETGSYQYQSLLKKIPPQHRNFNEVWKIFPTETGVFFFTFSHVFLYRDGVFEVLLANEKLLFAFQVNKTIFLQDESKGLLKLKGTEFIPIKGGAALDKHKSIWTMLPRNNEEIIIGTEQNGLYILTNNEIVPWNVSANNFLMNNQIFSGTCTSSGSFAIGTIQNGLVVINQDGKITKHINKDKGLQNNTVLSVFTDRDGTLWLGLDNGISALQIHSSVSLFSEGLGVLGAGYTSYDEENYRYFGTNQGLFYAAKSQNHEEGYFKPITGCEGQVWNLKKINNILLCAHSRGTFIIKENKAELISDISGTWTFLQLKDHSEFIIAGTYDGLNLYEINNETVKFKHKIKGFNESSRSLHQDLNGNIWIAHGYKGIFKLQLNKALDKVIYYKLYTDTEGLPSAFGNELFVFRGTLGVSTANGIYRYDDKTDRFSNNYEYKHIFRNMQVVKALEENNGNIWAFQNNKLSYFKKQSSGKYDLCTATIGTFNEKLIPAFENMSFTQNENLLIGFDNGFIHLNSQNMPDTINNMEVYIRKVSVKTENSDSLIFVGDSISSTVQYKIEAQYNSISFYFSTPYYKATREIQYSYKISNLQENWSYWQDAPFKEFNNLSPGTYTFSIRAKNLAGQISKPAYFTFTLLPPWYRTHGAYALFFSGLLIPAFLITKLLHRKIKRDKQTLIEKQAKELKRQEEHFEYQRMLQEQELIQLRNEKLQDKVAKQQQEAQIRNTELSSITMQITHKNEILTGIKAEIDKLSEKVNTQARKELRALSRTIQSDIKLDEDWERFQSHFELVHEGFFKRLQSQYKKLTPKDLKMCAYLRMNLSSKEISPLMNISIRTVENGRYRLRKKFKLDKDTNLVDFIMRI